MGFRYMAQRQQVQRLPGTHSIRHQGYVWLKPATASSESPVGTAAGCAYIAAVHEATCVRLARTQKGVHASLQSGPERRI